MTSSSVHEHRRGERREHRPPASAFRARGSYKRYVVHTCGTRTDAPSTTEPAGPRESKRRGGAQSPSPSAADPPMLARQRSYWSTGGRVVPVSISLLSKQISTRETNHHGFEALPVETNKQQQNSGRVGGLCLEGTNSKQGRFVRELSNTSVSRDTTKNARRIFEIA